MTDNSNSLNPTAFQPPEGGIGSRIKEARLRQAYDLSIEALSRLCKDCDGERQGITATTLLRYEQGKVLPGAREMRILCDALDVSADWLLFGFENPMDITFAEGFDLLRRLIDERQALTYPRRRRGVIDVVKQDKIIQARVPQKR